MTPAKRMRPGSAAALAALVAAPLLLAGCEVEGVFHEPDPSLNRMIVQPRMDVYRENTFFSDGRAMRPPPVGTVPRGTTTAPVQVVRGTERDGSQVSRIPIGVDRELLERGRDRFEIFCAPCHGVTGHADTAVARNMHLVRPPSLHTDRLRNAPVGHFYRVITEGYGVMPDYRNQLPLKDRWAVVAYVQALQLSQETRLEELPENLRREAKEALE